MAVKDDLLAHLLELQSERQQLGIVQMVQLTVERKRRFIDLARPLRHPLEASLRDVADADDVHAVLFAGRAPLDEIDIVAVLCEGDAFLVEDADIITPYVEALGEKINFDIISQSPLKAAITPLGGASLPFYKAIIKKYKLKNVELVLSEQNPDFHFIPLDHDGKIRMDPSSIYPMRPLIELVKNSDYDFVGASDPDADRFGCATKKGGLILPNHALCVMLDYMARKAGKDAPKKVGRTLGTTMLMDKIAEHYGLGIEEVNVGFKYFVDGLLNKELLMAGEESAGMSITNWVTEKDGILAVCLLLEIMCATGQDIAGLYEQLTALYGKSYYVRVDSPAKPEIKEKFKNLKEENFAELKTFAGQEVLRIRDTDGIKFYLKDSWLLARASGTENIIKLYAETFKSQEHLENLIREGRKIFEL